MRTKPLRLALKDRLRILGRLAFEKLTSARVHGTRLAATFPTHARGATRRISRWSSRARRDHDRARLWRHLSDAGNWSGRAASISSPLPTTCAAIWQRRIACSWIETTAPVLDRGRGQTKKGCFWAIVSDDRSHSGPNPPIVPFRYARMPSLSSSWTLQRTLPATRCL
ncbi:IS66 family transposase [Bradyrhizobium nanningense]|uniref:IS66 family transposase n=2 Tax=Bradyrhizobium TaxID=374 RepID=UPI003221751B